MCTFRDMGLVRARLKADTKAANALLVDANWLAKSLGISSCYAEVDRAGLLPARDSLVVLHAEWANGKPPASFIAGHIPGALHFDTDWLENGYPRWLLLDAPTLQQCFAARGIGVDDTIVVYAETYDAACRLWWVLRYCGAQDVRVLAGGLQRWREAGLPLEHVAAEVECAHRSPARFDVRVCDQHLVRTADVRVTLAQRDPQLVDVRSTNEFAGLVSGYEYLDRAGRIPGAVHASVEPLYDLLNCLDFAGIAAYWRERGVMPDRVDDEVAVPTRTNAQAGTPIFYCGSGWRSSVAVFCAACLGLQARNYSDGWCGWSTRYVKDDAARGSTPGWWQEPTDNPIE